jgi:hypothetical protein
MLIGGNVATEVLFAAALQTFARSERRSKLDLRGGSLGRAAARPVERRGWTACRRRPLVLVLVRRAPSSSPGLEPPGSSKTA